MDSHNRIKGGGGVVHLVSGFTLPVGPFVRLWTESCPLCIIHNISRIHFIFTDVINQLQKVCRALSFVTNSNLLIFGNFFKFSPLTLSYVHVMWMLIPHPSFYCSNLKFPMMRPLDDLLNIYSGFDPNCNFVFLAFFFFFFCNCTFHLVFVVASKLSWFFLLQ